MTSDLVANWFGDRFSDLHPELQKLHRLGGRLEGRVAVATGNGLAGHVGRVLARKLNVPSPGEYALRVEISHHPDGLHWDRSFDGAPGMQSVFSPVGGIDGGYWREASGPLQTRLTVDIVDGGWHWRCLGFRLFGIPLPRVLFPNSVAHKFIEDGKYRFLVRFSAPIFGHVLSYGGLLEPHYRNGSI